MKQYTFLFLISILLTVSCASTKTVENYHIDPAIQLQRILDEEVNNPKNQTVGQSLTVISPKLGVDFSGAVGYSDINKQTILDESQPFRIASLTKIYVATGILRLREKGLLNIEDPISKYISKEHITILRKGGYNPDAITLRHCMRHISGLYDYAEGGPEYIEEASKDPAKRWTRTEQIQFAMDHGKPHAAPGAEKHYSDTGYVLLGEIIERLTNSGLAEGLRELLKFDELGMSATWLESLEDRPEGLPTSVRRYMGEMDATDWDNSVDLYGGGGLSSTTRDLSVFLQSLFNGDIFEKEDTLAVMLLQKEFTPGKDGIPDNRLGFGRLGSKTSNIEAFMHSGFWGTIFMHFPAYNCSIAFNDTNDGGSKALQRVINYIQWLDKEQKK